MFDSLQVKEQVKTVVRLRNDTEVGRVNENSFYFGPALLVNMFNQVFLL
jgi:hypothetical protein